MDNQELQAKLGIPIVQKKEGNYELYGVFNSVQKRKSTIDKDYETRIERMAAMLNHDRTVFMTQIMDVGPDGKNEVGGPRPLRLLHTEMSSVIPTVQVFSDIDYDRKKLSQSSQQQDRLKIRAIERIDAEFEEALQQAESAGNSSLVQQIKHRKNLAWSVVKEDIEQSDWKRVRNKQIQKSIDQVLGMSNNFSNAEKYNMFREVNSTFRGNAQEQIQKFQEFIKGNKFFTYDIETVGDALNTTDKFSVSEIAIQGFKKNIKGDFVKSDDKFLKLVRIRNEDAKTMNSIIEKLEADRYSFNALQDWEKRTIIDLMRYSTHGSEQNRAQFGDNLKHNAVIENVFDEREKIKTSHVIENMDEMIKHMKSGLSNLQDKRYTTAPEDVIREFNQYVNDRNKNYFVGFNSDRFDNQKLKQWSAMFPNAEEIQMPYKTLDYMAVIQTLYPNPHHLHEELRTLYGTEESEYLKGMTTLGELQRSLGLDLEGKHSAVADIGEEGLGGVITKSMYTLSNRIDSAQEDIGKGLRSNFTDFSWTNDKVQSGQMLFSSGGYQAYQDGELSFAADFDEETGRYIPTSSGFNNTVINSRSFYEVKGVHDISANNQKILALQLYNEIDNKHAFIVREGEDAESQLANFIQKRFYNWDGLSKEKQEEIYRNHLKDLARRRYDRMFSLEKAGSGKTYGFEAAKRLYGNANILAERIDGQSNKLLEKALEISKAEGRDVQEVYKELTGKRITHDEMINKMDFDSLWDDDTKSWKFNESEMREFFEMRNRLLSEREHYNSAIKIIEDHYAKELDSVKGDFNREAEIKKQRDMAWMIYSNRIKEQIQLNGGELPYEEVPMRDFDSRIIHVNDEKGANPRRINLLNYQTARSSINNYVYAGLNDLTADEKNRRARERLSRMVKNMYDQEIIKSHVRDKMFEIIDSNIEAGNATTQIADYLLNDVHYIPFEKTRKQSSVGFNNGISTIDKHLNETLARDAISKTNDLLVMKVNNSTMPGTKVRFGDSINEFLDDLDNRAHLSGLQPNNRSAVEDVLHRLLKTQGAQGLNVAVSVDKENSNLKITAFNLDQGSSIIPKLERGEHVGNALNITMPLINENGTHVVGNRFLNARRIADYENGQIVMKSTAQMIAEDYNAILGRAIKRFNDGDVEGAQKLIDRQLNKSVSRLSGIQRSLTSSADQYYWNNNMSDFLKQSQIEIESAMIKQLYGKPGGVKYSDFTNPEDVFNKDRSFKRRVSFDDLYPEASYSLSLKMGDWLSENNLKGFTGSLKAEHVYSGRVAQVDVRELIPYGDYIFQGRDNSVQFMNAHLLEPEVVQRIKDSGRYVSFDPTVTTDLQQAYMKEWNNQPINQGKAMGVNVKVTYMNDADLAKRLEEMKDTHRDLLLREGILNEDGSWNQVRKPRIYEQQGLVANDFANVISVNEQKVMQGVTPRKILLDQLDKGKIVSINPGDVIGRKDGQEVRWESPYKATMHLQNGELLMKWQEQPFKWSISGEKATDFRISPELMKAITGSDDTTFVINPNVVKHKDYGMIIAGKANLIGQYVRDQMDLLEQANANKASALGQKRGMIQQHIDEITDKAKQFGLYWNADERTFYERTRNLNDRKINLSAMDEFMESLGIDHTTTAGGQTFETGILTAHANKVSNWSKVIDHTGQRVIDILDDGTPVYDTSDRTGVKWGHRELAVLNDLGLNETYNATMNQIISQAQDEDAFIQNNPSRRKRINRLQETHNMMTALASLKDENYVHAANVGTLTLDAFEDLPIIEQDRHTLMNTIFDQDHVMNKLGVDPGTNMHGYWLQLPTSTENGKERGIGINVNGADVDRVQRNKIFIPFTNTEGAGSDIHFRELQRHIADIYEKAKAVDMDELQSSVDRYVNRLVKDITSSKGQVGESVLKAVMPNSATGLFKLMDPLTSHDLDGEFTFISEGDAKKLGVYDALKNGDELFTMNVRYPTFHKHAMQISKLRMDSSIKEGEFHTTSLMSAFMKADSDGDYDNIVVMKDKHIQNEWRKHYEQQMEARDRAYNEMMNNRDSMYADHINDDYKADRKFDSASIAPEGVEPITANTKEEIAAKIGKRIIGSASNLNYAMSQMARDYLADDFERKEAMLRFGQNIEQKLISSKHGGTIAGNSAPAIDFVRAVYAGDYNEALRLHDEFKAAGTKIVDQETFDKAFEGIDIIKRRSEKGLRTEGLKFGTSYGIDTKNGIGRVIDMIMGDTPIDDSVNANGYLNALRQSMGIEVQRPSISDPERPGVDPYQSIEPKAREPRDTSFSGKLGDIAEDATGGWKGAGDKVREIAHAISKNKWAKRGVIGGALALGGLAGYNILSHDDPLEPPHEEQASHQDVASSPLPPLDYGNALQNADISVSASGASRQDSDELSRMINEGMRMSGMSAGPTRITVNQQDNTQKLNRIWYRDKVQENI